AAPIAAPTADPHSAAPGFAGTPFGHYGPNPPTPATPARQGRHRRRTTPETFHPANLPAFIRTLMTERSTMRRDRT
ncbi:MAG: hypothetical protein N2383_09365, partial [Caldilineales bacterium]|nr:hypothetical protein [Caldilineales bacterium]